MKCHFFLICEDAKLYFFFFKSHFFLIIVPESLCILRAAEQALGKKAPGCLSEGNAKWWQTCPISSAAASELLDCCCPREKVSSIWKRLKESRISCPITFCNKSSFLINIYYFCNVYLLNVNNKINKSVISICKDHTSKKNSIFCAILLSAAIQDWLHCLPHGSSRWNMAGKYCGCQIADNTIKQGTVLIVKINIQPLSLLISHFI